MAKIQTGESQVQVLGITAAAYMLVALPVGAFQGCSRSDILLMTCTSITLAAVLYAWRNIQREVYE